MKVILLLLFVVPVSSWFFTGDTIVTSTGPVNATCERLANEGKCEFFDCFERRLPCGVGFYIRRFAKKYCAKFLAVTNTFDQAGRRFLDSSRICVMQDMLKYYRNQELNCDTLENFALAKLGPCYLQNGFCDVIEANSQTFLDVFEFGDASSLMGPLNEIANTCGGSALSNFLRAMSRRVAGALSRFFGLDNRK